MSCSDVIQILTSFNRVWCGHSAKESGGWDAVGSRGSSEWMNEMKEGWTGCRALMNAGSRGIADVGHLRPLGAYRGGVAKDVSGVGGMLKCFKCFGDRSAGKKGTCARTERSALRTYFSVLLLHQRSPFVHGKSTPLGALTSATWSERQRVFFRFSLNEIYLW